MAVWCPKLVALHVTALRSMAASNREDVQRHCWSFALRELLRTYEWASVVHQTKVHMTWIANQAYSPTGLRPQDGLDKMLFIAFTSQIITNEAFNMYVL